MAAHRSPYLNAAHLNWICVSYTTSMSCQWEFCRLNSGWNTRINYIFLCTNRDWCLMGARDVHQCPSIIANQRAIMSAHCVTRRECAAALMNHSWKMWRMENNGRAATHGELVLRLMFDAFSIVNIYARSLRFRHRANAWTRAVQT